MKNETGEFIAEGMIRYKQATSVLVSFRKEVEDKLKSILNNRRDWGQFIPKGDTHAIKSTFGSAYPLLNAKLEGEYKGDDVKVVIAVNWYQSESDYPFYCVWIEPTNQHLTLLREYEWGPNFEFKEDALRFDPRPDDFDMVRDFDALLDEFIGFFGE